MCFVMLEMDLDIWIVFNQDQHHTQIIINVISYVF